MSGINTEWRTWEIYLKGMGSEPTGNQVNGICGSANGGAFTAAPATNLCSAGTASAVTGSGPWNWTCQGSNGGSDAFCSAAIQTYTVTFASGGNGTITGNVNQTVNYGESATQVTAVPDAGYQFVNWIGDNSPVLTDNPLTLSNVTANISLTANFASNAPPPDTGARLTATPLNLQFGNVVVGTSTTLALKISNSGDADLSISSVTSVGARFSVFPPTSFTIAPGVFRIVNIGFAPTLVGDSSGTVTVTSGNTGQQAIVTVSGKGLAVEGTPVLNIPPAIDFGNVMAGQRVSKEITIGDSSNGAPLVISQANLTGDGFIWGSGGAPTLPLTVQPGLSVNLPIVFAPGSGTGGSNFTGTLTIASNDPNRSSVNVALSGNSVSPVTVQTLPALSVRVKNGTLYDMISAASCASVGGEVKFGNGTLAGDSFTVALTDQTGATVSSASFSAPQGSGTATFGGIAACGLKDGVVAVTVNVTRAGSVMGSMTGTSTVKNTSPLAAPVLNPLPQATVFSSLQVCGTAPAGVLVQIGGGAGSASTQLGTGQTSFCLDVPLRRNTENSLIVTATDLSTGNVASAAPIKVTQVDPSSVVIAKASSRPLAQSEVDTLVQNGVITLDDPSNYNVSMFTIVLTIGQSQVTVSQPVVVDPTPGSISYGSSGGGGGGGSSYQVVVIQTPTGQTIPGVIIIDGRVRTLKEFFQVVLAIQNTTTGFDLTDMVASIALPSGLTPVKVGLGVDVDSINTGSAVDTVAIGTIAPQQTAFNQFIIRGDGIGTHEIAINFQGFLSGGGLTDPFPISGSAKTSVQILGPPQLDIVVRHPGDPNSSANDVSAGEIYTLTVDVTNHSPVPALYTSLDLLIGQGAVLVDTDGNELPGSTTTRNLGNIPPGQTVSQSFLVKSRVAGKIIACQAVASENLTLSVDIGGGSCNIANTIPANFAIPSPNASPTVMEITPLNNQSNTLVTASVMAVLTPQAGCLTPDTWTNVITDWIDPNDHSKGTNVISADLVSVGTFYLEELDSLGNPVRHIPTDLSVTHGVDGKTTTAVLRLGLAAPLSQSFLNGNARYRATLLGGKNGVCNNSLNSVTMPTTFQWMFYTAPVCAGGQPTVSMTQPLDGSVNQPLNPNIVLNFSQEMDPSSFNFDQANPFNSNFLILAGGTVNDGDVAGGVVVPGTAAFSNLFQTFTFTPAGSLPAGQTIRIRLKNTLKDACGNFIDAPAKGIKLFSFVTIPITVTFSSGGNGTLSGATNQSVSYGDSSSAVTANPAIGYHFVNWTDAENNVVSTANPIILTNITTNTSLTANFAINTYTMTLNSGPNGSITGPTTVNHGDKPTYIITPNNGYHLLDVTVNDVSVGAVTSYTFTIGITGPVTIAAIIVPNQLTVTFSAGPHGKITGTASQTVIYGGSTTPVTAVPDRGYLFLNWTDGAGNVVSSDNPVTITNVTTDMAIRANFVPEHVTVTFSTGSYGRIIGRASQTIDYNGSTSAVTANPITGYQFVNWTGPNGFVSTSQTLTLQNVTANQTVKANFAPIQFTINFAAGPNGSLTGDVDQTVYFGGSATAVRAVPATGYHFVNWTGDGGFATTSANPLTVRNVKASRNITANFAINRYTVTFTAGRGGSISGVRTQTVDYDSSTTAVTAVPSRGYRFIRWTSTNGFSSTDNPLTMDNVKASQNITAVFSR